MLIGNDSHNKTDETSTKHGEGGAVIGKNDVSDVESVLSDCTSDNGRYCKNQHQGNTNQGLNEGKGATAHLILDLHAQHGEAGDPRNTCESTQKDCEDERENKVIN